METPIHKITLFVTEINNQFGADDIQTTIENALDNALIAISKVTTKDAGEWSDIHPLNSTNTDVEKYFDSLV